MAYKKVLRSLSAKNECAAEPTICMHQSETGNATQGTSTVSLTGLSYSTTYYVRAYARSAVGITYSESTSFTTANNWPGGDDNTPPDV
jgi:hypothetical protein